MPHALRIAAAVSFLLILFRYALGRSPKLVPQFSRGPSGAGAAAVLSPSLLLGVLVCWPVLSLYFFCDDFAHVAAAGNDFAAALADSFLHGLILNRGLYRPLGFALLLAEAKIFHGRALGFHLISLLLHLVNALGLFLVARRIGFSSRAAATAAALFVVLPINAEALAWPSVQYDLLATALLLFATFFYARFGEKARARDLVFSLLLFAFAMLAKEDAFIYPILLLALHIFIVGRRNLAALGAHFALAAVGFALRWRMIGGIGGYTGSHGALAFDFSHSLAGLFRRGPDLEIFGLNWLEPPRWHALVLFAAIAVVLIVLAVFSRPRYRPQLFFGAAWTLIALLPTHSLLLSLGAGLTGSHILYLSSVGMAIFLGAAIAGLPRPTGDDEDSLAATPPPMLASSPSENFDRPANLSPAFRRAAALQSLRGLPLALLLIAFSLGMRHNLRAWRAASADVLAFQSQLLAAGPAPPANAQILVQGLPAFDRGACAFAVGLRPLIQLAYHRRDIIAVQGSASSSRALLAFRWDGEVQRLTPLRSEPAAVRAK